MTGKGDTRRPRATHVTREQYDANYAAVFRSRATEPSDSSAHGSDSGVPQEPGGQPDPSPEKPVEAEGRGPLGPCPECKADFTGLVAGCLGSRTQYRNCCGARVESCSLCRQISPSEYLPGVTVQRRGCLACMRPSTVLTDIDYGDDK